MLNIVNKSPLDRSALDACLRIAAPGALLLIEDGVYAAVRGTAAEPRITAALARFRDGVTTIDYGGFVDLVAEHNACQSWL